MKSAILKNPWLWVVGVLIAGALVFPKFIQGGAAKVKGAL